MFLSSCFFVGFRLFFHVYTFFEKKTCFSFFPVFFFFFGGRRGGEGGVFFRFFFFHLFFVLVFVVFFVFFFVDFFVLAKKKKTEKKRKHKKGKMKRNASKRDERHGRSRHRTTIVLEFVTLILRPKGCNNLKTFNEAKRVSACSYHCNTCTCLPSHPSPYSCSPSLKKKRQNAATMDKLN